MSNKNTGTNLGFEDKHWMAADKLRGTMDSAEYKHVVLGLIFLKYISDSFLEKYEALQAEEYADPEDRDEYLADNVFWVPAKSRWSFLQGTAKDPKIGQFIDEAMTAIELDNKTLKGVLPKDYARPALDMFRLSELIDRTYQTWRGETKDGDYEDKPGFCKSVASDDIKSHHYVLTPGRYVGAEAIADDGIPFEEKMAELSDTLYEQMRESIELDAVIRKNLILLGFGE